MQLASFELERDLWARHRWLVFADEVGRGAYGGPVMCGMCAVSPEHVVGAPPVADSKLVRPARRAELAAQVVAWAPTAVGAASALEIDQLGMAAALRLAAGRALEQIRASGVEVTCVAQDGSASWLPEDLEGSVERLVRPKLDLTSVGCAAASIVAKVRRDELMRELGARFPLWPALADSAGYGTAAHEAQIREHGLCPEHRFSWSFAARLAPGVTRESLVLPAG